MFSSEGEYQEAMNSAAQADMEAQMAKQIHEEIARLKAEIEERQAQVQKLIESLP